MERLARLETTVEHIESGIKTIEGRIEKFQNKTEENFTEVRNSITANREKSFAEFKWIIGSVLITVLIPIVLKLLGWIT